LTSEIKGRATATAFLPAKLPAESHDLLGFFLADIHLLVAQSCANGKEVRMWLLLKLLKSPDRSRTAYVRRPDGPSLVLITVRS